MPGLGDELSTGRRVGPYTLLFRLGKGGMGEVWCARTTGSATGMGDFTKLVALKLLRGAEEGSNASVMFFDEAKVAAALQHVSIVPTLDLGAADGAFYLAMEMIRGPSLTALLQRLALRKTPPAPALVAYVGERIASALDYAHERAELQGRKLRLVHRDISPHNVLLDPSGNVLLSDFGVARTAVQDHLSRVGTVRGKPSYMAPEQVSGGEVDGRTDVFALGTVLYEMASLKRLFGRGDPMRSMRAVLEDQPRSLTALVPDFPEPLARVIHTALEKRPSDRFQSASELAQALAERSRSLPGAPTVQRDLAALVAELFPVGAFDVETKARDALAAIDELTQTGGAETTGATGPSSFEEADQAGPTTLATRFASPMVWPVASHADPLAPEALAEVQEEQTRFGAYAPPPRMFTPPPAAPSSRGLGLSLAAAMTLVGVVALTGVGLALARRPPAETPLITPGATPETREHRPPKVTPADEEPAGTEPAPGPAEPEPEPEGGKPAGAGSSQRGGRTGPNPAHGTKTPSPPPPTPKPPPPAPEPAGAEAMTQSLLSCIEVVGRRDPEARTTFMRRLSSTGKHEAGLTSLLRECRASMAKP